MPAWPPLPWSLRWLRSSADSAAEIVAGPDTGGPPQAPLAITGGKIGGTNPGFLVEDERRKRYVVKFDPPDTPELQTAASHAAEKKRREDGYERAKRMPRTTTGRQRSFCTPTAPSSRRSWRPGSSRIPQRHGTWWTA
jgi:hypothetical protein